MATQPTYFKSDDVKGCKFCVIVRLSKAKKKNIPPKLGILKEWLEAFP